MKNDAEITDMVWRVADAIAKANGHEFTMGDYTIMARAAMEAMREPTDEMAKAWLAYYSDPNDVTGFSIQAKPVWQCMLDAALNPAA